MHLSFPSFPINFSPCPSLHATIILANIWHFFTLFMHPKTCPAGPFGALFALFLLPSLPMHPSAPIRIDLHPSTPIHTNFWQTRQNMMSGEISPAIGAENMSYLFVFGSVSLVFLCACPPVPRHTHANPSLPICIHICTYIPYSYVCSYVI